MCLQGWLLASLRDSQLIHGTMQVPQRHCCEAKSWGSPTLTHSPLLPHPLFTKPLSTAPLFWIFTFTPLDLFLLSHAQHIPTLQPAGP